MVSSPERVHILLVEDQAIIALAESKTLRDAGYAVDRGDFLLDWIGVPDAQGRRIVSATSYGPEQSYVSDVTIDLFDHLTSKGQNGTDPRMTHRWEKALSRGGVPRGLPDSGLRGGKGRL